MNLVLLVVFGFLMHATRSFGGAAPGSSGTLLAFGYVLVSAFFAGGLFKQLRLPRLTGYIVAGIVAGPMVLGLLSREMVASLELVNGIAIAMLGLTAGNEIELKSMKPLLRSIGAITVFGVLGTAALLSVAVWLLRPFLPFMHGLTPAQAAAVSLVLGVVMVAQSPAVVVALRDELRADGAVVRTAIGVVVLADLVVIVLVRRVRRPGVGRLAAGLGDLRLARRRDGRRRGPRGLSEEGRRGRVDVPAARDGRRRGGGAAASLRPAARRDRGGHARPQRDEDG
jgi:hypothetical protein